MLDDFDEVLRLMGKINVIAMRLTLAHNDMAYRLRQHEVREEKWATERRERWRQILSGRHPMMIFASGMVGVIFASFFGSLLAMYMFGDAPNPFGAQVAPATRSTADMQQLQCQPPDPSRGMTPNEKAAEDAEYR